MKTLVEIEEEIKSTVIDLVQTFGLHVDYDQWDEKGWIRVKSNDWPEDFGYNNKCVLLYRDDVKQLGIQYVKDELIQNLIHLGGKLKAKEIRKTLNL